MGALIRFPARPASPPAHAGAGGVVAAFPVLRSRRKFLIREAHRIAAATHGASLENVARFIAANCRAVGISPAAADREAAAAVRFVAALITSWSAPSSGGPNRAA